MTALMRLVKAETVAFNAARVGVHVAQARVQAVGVGCGVAAGRGRRVIVAEANAIYTL